MREGVRFYRISRLTTCSVRLLACACLVSYTTPWDSRCDSSLRVATLWDSGSLGESERCPLQGKRPVLNAAGATRAVVARFAAESLTQTARLLRKTTAPSGVRSDDENFGFSIEQLDSRLGCCQSGLCASDVASLAWRGM